MQNTLEQPGAQKALNPASQVLGSVCCCFVSKALGFLAITG